MLHERILNTVFEQCKDWVQSANQDLMSNKFNLKVAVQRDNALEIAQYESAVNGNKQFIRKFEALIDFVERNLEGK